uniref:Sulfotransferase n=1 Tax=Oncorhynchus mykiss TaxID=8022 RepID=A0A8K9XDH5_ONCMY
MCYFSVLFIFLSSVYFFPNIIAHVIEQKICTACYTMLLTSVGRTVAVFPYCGFHLRIITIICGNFDFQMLVVFRNPKDTVVSYYHFMNTNPVLPNAKSWDSFFTDFMEGEVAWGSYFNHALAWEKLMDNPNILMATYEQMKENLGQGVQQISKFFDFSLTEEQVQTIAGSKNTHGKHGNVFFRKGEVGDWKNHLSEAQSKQMDEKFEKHLVLV